MSFLLKNLGFCKSRNKLIKMGPLYEDAGNKRTRHSGHLLKGEERGFGVQLEE